MSEILQTVTLGRVVSEPGLIRLTYDYQLPSNLTEFSVTFRDSWAEIRSEGFRTDGRTCEWRSGHGADPSIELQFEVDSGIGASSYVDTGEWAITRLPNLGWSWRYRSGGGNPELVERYDIDGEGVISGDGAVAYLGPYTEYTGHASETDEEFRLIVPRDAELRDNPQSILGALTHASDYLDIGALNDSVLAIAAPTSAQNWAAKGTQRGDDGFWVRDDAVTDEPNETWVHEYVHTRQRFARSTETYWFQEGTADYLAVLAALARGDIECSEFRRFLTSTRDHSAVLSDTSTWRSKSTAYRRGRRACAALDEVIREGSGGDSTLMAALAELNRRLEDSEGTSRVEISHVREAVSAVTDRGVSDWFRKYVRGAQVPEIGTDPSVLVGESPGSDTGVQPEPAPEPEPGSDSVNRCPVCDKTTKDDLCPVCGHQFVAGVSISESDSRIHECPVCEQRTTERFCPVCGYNFESESGDEQPGPGDGTTGRGSDGICPICDTASDGRFCPTCGYDVGGSGEPGVPSTGVSGVRTCDICNTETEDRRCPTCGAELY